MLFAFAPAATEKSRHRAARPTIAPMACVPWTEPQGAQLQAQTCGKPRKAQVGGSRCVPKSEASAGCPRTGCTGHICKLQNRSRCDAVQRQACSPPPPPPFLPLLPLLSFPALSLLTLFPSQSSCASRPGRGDKAWEGARPTSRVPVRNEGGGAHRLSNLNCLAFPAADCLMAISA